MKSSRTGHHWLLACGRNVGAAGSVAVGGARPRAGNRRGRAGCGSGPDLATRVADLEAYFTNSAPRPSACPARATTPG